MLLDTGCTHSLVSKAIFDQIAPDSVPYLENSLQQIMVADGSISTVLGCVSLKFEVDGQTFKHKMLVTDVVEDVILGMDFIRSHEVKMNISSDEVSIGDAKVPVHCFTTSTPQCCRVQVRDDIIIEAGSRVLVPTIATKPLPEGTYMTEPLQKFANETPVMVARALVKGGNRRVPIEILNLTGEDIFIHAKTHAALLCPVTMTDAPPLTHDCDTRKETPKPSVFSTRPSDIVLPPELQELYDKLPEELSREEKEQFKLCLYNHKQAFTNKEHPLGRTSVLKHDIELTKPDPIKQPPRREPIHLRAEAEKEVQSMLDKGVIEPSTSPWSSPVVLVRKKDSSIRYCIDYRKVNNVTKKDSFPIPSIEESLTALKDAKFFSTLDLCSGYWQVELTDKAKEISAFSTGRNLYQFKVLPFGLSNAPATFERLMERVLSGLHWHICLIYLDDVIIHSKSVSEHIDRLGQVFSRL